MLIKLSHHNTTSLRAEQTQPYTFIKNRITKIERDKIELRRVNCGTKIEFDLIAEAHDLLACSTTLYSYSPHNVLVDLCTRWQHELVVNYGAGGLAEVTMSFTQVCKNIN